MKGNLAVSLKFFLINTSKRKKPQIKQVNDSRKKRYHSIEFLRIDNNKLKINFHLKIKNPQAQSE